MSAMRFGRRYRRHERFTKAQAADPALQVAQELNRQKARDFIQDVFDLVEGRQTAGAHRARIERDRLQRLVSEAKRRALVGADPLNLTGHTKHAKPAKQKLAADPIEHIGHITRTRSSIDRLSGKNKLDQRQVLAAESYRDAFEAVHSSLGGSMDFSRARGGGGTSAPAEAVLIASEKLKAARNLLGATSIIILEEIVCRGRTTEECARLVYSYTDAQTPVARDINHVGRRLRESLTELGRLWHPLTGRRPMESFRPDKSEMSTGSVEPRIVSKATAYVTR